MKIISEGIDMNVESINYDCNSHTGCQADTKYEGGSGSLQCGGSVTD